MVSMLEKNILVEAANLLKIQKKDDKEGNFGASFNDLFKVRSEENSPVAEIGKNEKIEKRQNIDEAKGLSADITQHEQAANQQKSAEPVNKSIKKDDKGMEFAAAREESSKSAKIKKEIEPLKISLNKEEKKGLTKKENKNFPYEMVNIDLRNLQAQKLNYKDLDIAARERIKEIVRDLKMGKISEEAANSSIAQIINSSSNKKLNAAQKESNINPKNNLNKNTDIIHNDKIEAKHENPKVKNVDSDNVQTKAKPEISAQEKRGQMDKIKKIIEDNKEAKNNEQTAKKDSSFEINLNNNDNKIIINDFAKTRDIQPQKLLEQNKETVFNQIAKNTKIILSEGQTKFSTMLRPEELGRIDMKFVMKDGKVNGRMILQNQESADFFKSNVEELKAVFQKANVELENIDIILAGNNFSGNQRDFGSSDSSESRDFSFNGMNSAGNKNYFEDNALALNANYSRFEMSKINIMA